MLQNSTRMMALIYSDENFLDYSKAKTYSEIIKLCSLFNELFSAQSIYFWSNERENEREIDRAEVRVNPKRKLLHETHLAVVLNVQRVSLSLSFFRFHSLKIIFFKLRYVPTARWICSNRFTSTASKYRQRNL